MEEEKPPPTIFERYYGIAPDDILHDEAWNDREQTVRYVREKNANLLAKGRGGMLLDVPNITFIEDAKFIPSSRYITPLWFPKGTEPGKLTLWQRIKAWFR